MAVKVVKLYLQSSGHTTVQTRNLKIELTPFAADMQTFSVKRNYVHDHTQLLQQPQLPL